MIASLNDNITPLYLQLKNHLSNLIESGEIMPGGRLSSEKELEIQFNVSRITVRRALQELAAEEKIVRIPGKGSFILRPKIVPLPSLTSFSENMRAEGFEPSYRNTLVSIVPTPSRVKHFFGDANKDQAIHIERTLLADGMPMALQDEYLPYSFYEMNSNLFTADVLNHFSMYMAMEMNLGIKLVRAEEFVDASQATPTEAEALGMKRGDLVLVITRMTYSESNRPVEFVKLIFRADRYRYHVELFRTARRSAIP